MDYTPSPNLMGRLLADDAGAAPLASPPAVDAPAPRAELRTIPRAIPEALLDPDAVKIVRRLVDAGFTAYLVGGCVRDLLFGLHPKDFDVATSATPKDVRRLFRNCRIIGRRFRLAHVFFRDKIIEVATFRAPSTGSVADGNGQAAFDELALRGDGAAEGFPGDADGSQPGERFADGEGADATDNGGGDGPAEAAELLIRDDNVFGTAEEDAIRRDFTANALFYDIAGQQILDYVGGVADIERRELRTIGDPHLRLREDPIRILRAIRLAARMGCTIEASTWEAILVHRHEILRAAAPRIGEDILRMFRGGAILPAFDMMLESGVLEVVLPELHAFLRQRILEDGPGEVMALRAALRMADARTQAGRPLSSAVHYALLLAPLALSPRSIDGVMRVPTQAEAGELLRPIAQRLAISRKDGERVRQLLYTLPKLMPPAPGRKRKTSGPLVRRAFFPEALDVFEMLAWATGEQRDEARRWRQKLAEAFPDGLPSEQPKPAPAARAGGGGGDRGGRRGGGRRGPRRR